MLLCSFSSFECGLSGDERCLPFFTETVVYYIVGGVVGGVLLVLVVIMVVVIAVYIIKKRKKRTGKMCKFSSLTA